jgi:stress-induced morphogen
MAVRANVTTVRTSLRKAFSSWQPVPQVEVVRSRGGKTLHVYVISDTFAKMNLTQRHDVVEQVLQCALDASTQIQISALFVLTPQEAEGFAPVDGSQGTDGFTPTPTPHKRSAKATAARR